MSPRERKARKRARVGYTKPGKVPTRLCVQAPSLGVVPMADVIFDMVRHARV